ncbi:unnamed protein product [Caenorhabditis nigoni]
MDTKASVCVLSILLSSLSDNMKSVCSIVFIFLLAICAAKIGVSAIKDWSDYTGEESRDSKKPNTWADLGAEESSDGKSKKPKKWDDAAPEESNTESRRPEALSGLFDLSERSERRENRLIGPTDSTEPGPKALHLIPSDCAA